MTNPTNPESEQSIIPLRPHEVAEVADQQLTHLAASGLGEVTVASTLAGEEVGHTRSAVAVAELPSPEEIPSLLPQLEHIDSAHLHIYDDSKSVYTKAKVAEKTPEDKRTPEQKQLLGDVETMRSFARYSSSYKDVYTPEELRGLVGRLELLSKKNRPDFDGVEGRIIDVVLDGLRREVGGIPKNVREIARRAEKNMEGRKGMLWDTLAEMAKVASAIIRERAKGYTRDYFVDIRDPEPDNHPDLSRVYQFVADDNALAVVGQRMDKSQEARREAFVTNSSLINEWYSKVEPVLARLPRDFRVGRFGAAYEVRQMVETMNNRLKGDTLSGRDKDYRLDTVGAIKLQQKIGHTVEAIRAQLSGDETEIVPLDE